MLAALRRYFRKTSEAIRRRIRFMVEKRSRESHRRAEDGQHPTYAGRNTVVNAGTKPPPVNAKLAQANGKSASSGSSAKTRSRPRRVRSYQPTAEVILFLPKENGTNNTSSPSRPASPRPTNGGKAATPRGHSGMGSAKGHSSTSRSGTGRPSSMHVLSQRVSRLFATKQAALAKGDLPPIPTSAKPGQGLAPLSTTRLSPTRVRQRSRFSKLLPPTPISIPETPNDYTPHDALVLQRRKVFLDSLRRSRRDGTNDMPAPRALGVPEVLTRMSSTEQDADDVVHPLSKPRRSSLKSIGRRVTRKLSISRRRKNDGDGDRTSRMRLSRLTIPGRLSHCPSTGSASSVVIQPTTPAGGRKSIWGSSKRLVELEAHVTEEQMPVRIKHILQQHRGADAPGPSQAHVKDSSANGESYHSDLSLAIEVLRGEVIVEEFSMTSPVD